MKVTPLTPEQTERFRLACDFNASVDEAKIIRVFKRVLKKNNLAHLMGIQIAHSEKELRPKGVLSIYIDNADFLAGVMASIEGTVQHKIGQTWNNSRASIAKRTFANHFGYTLNMIDVIWAVACYRRITFYNNNTSMNNGRITLDFDASDLLDAASAGAWQITMNNDNLFILPIPTILKTDMEGRLHSETGPAFQWGDCNHYSWQGVEVPSHVIEHPEEISAGEIAFTMNTEVRRIMIERYGLGRYMFDLHAEEIDRETFNGRTCVLYRHTSALVGVIASICVVNATPEPDGHCKVYHLRVPPSETRVIHALAWTFNMDERAYRELAQES